VKITPSPGDIVHTIDGETVRYDHGVEVDVPEALGVYFVLSGWASFDRATVSPESLSLLPSEPAPPATEPVDLEVQNVVQPSGSEV
jgi:hypothetical protein